MLFRSTGRVVHHRFEVHSSGRSDGHREASVAGHSRRKVESTMTHQNRKGGFTIVELLVVVSIIALLIALLLPAIAKGRDKALITQSVSNLKNLASANEVYAGDWGERQFTAIPDDFGLVGGNCDQYKSQVACPPPQFLGWDGNGIWGYFLGSGGKCPNWPEACYNWIIYIPMQFGTGSNPGGGNSYGSFRMPGIKAFHDYVGKRFYDPTFYAPKDLVPLANIQKYFQSASEFAYDGTNYEDSSYCWSPAAIDRKSTRLNSSHSSVSRMPSSA